MEITDKRRINVRGIIWREGKLLAVKHKDENGNQGRYWVIPGGGLDPHESLTDGVARELHEELGVKASVGKLLFVQQFRSKRRNYEEELELFFHITNYKAFEYIELTKTSHGLDEIARVEFIDPSKEAILPEFIGKLTLSDYITGNNPPYIYTELGK